MDWQATGVLLAMVVVLGGIWRDIALLKKTVNNGLLERTSKILRILFGDDSKNEDGMCDKVNKIEAYIKEDRAEKHARAKGKVKTRVHD